ncbi:hypothetical protein HDU91_002266 [Kappamyces sp. JEL0680]|nr:hypothetical protein HDU91_002266 [Kappamyces sp. JEL0680]
MEKDQVFVPPTRSRVEKRNKLPKTTVSVSPTEEGAFALLEDAPLMDLVNLVSMLIFGWPLYLLLNKTSQKHKGWANHFNPSAPIFEDRERPQVSLSNIGIGVAAAALVYAARTFGIGNVVFFYFIPYLNVNFWLVLITFLQHTDPVVPKYRNQEWDFMKGALATIDRDFGILNHFFHHM